MRKRLKRIALYTGIAFVVLLVAAGLLVRFMLTGPRVKRFLEKSLSENLNQKVTIENVSLEFWKGLDIAGLTIHNETGSTDTPILTVKKIDIDADVRSFIKSRFARLTASVTVMDPSVFLERAAGGVPMAGDVPGAKSGGRAARKSGKSIPAGALLGPVKMLNFNITVK